MPTHGSGHRLGHFARLQVDGCRHIVAGASARLERCHDAANIFGGHVLGELLGHFRKSGRTVIQATGDLTYLVHHLRIADTGQRLRVGYENLGKVNMRHGWHLLLNIHQMVSVLGTYRHGDLSHRRVVGCRLKRVNHLQHGEEAQLTAITALHTATLRVHVVTRGLIL